MRSICVIGLLVSNIIIIAQLYAVDNNPSLGYKDKIMDLINQNFTESMKIYYAKKPTKTNLNKIIATFKGLSNAEQITLMTLLRLRLRIFLLAKANEAMIKNIISTVNDKDIYEYLENIIVNYMIIAELESQRLKEIMKGRSSKDEMKSTASVNKLYEDIINTGYNIAFILNALINESKFTDKEKFRRIVAGGFPDTDRDIDDFLKENKIINVPSRNSFLNKIYIGGYILGTPDNITPQYLQYIKLINVPKIKNDVSKKLDDILVKIKKEINKYVSGGPEGIIYQYL